MNNLNLDFHIFKGRCYGNPFLFSAISFLHRKTTKQHEIGIWSGKKKYRKFCLLSNGTIRNDLGDPDCQNSLYYSFGSDMLKKYATNLCRFFSAGGRPTVWMTAAKLVCYPSRDVASGTNFCHFRTDLDAILLCSVSIHSICCIAVDL